MSTFETVALGSCYVDIDASGFPYDASGIPVGVELVGGDYEMVPGGSAVNFCRLLHRLGVESAFIGMVGEDENSHTLERLLREAGVEPALIRKPDVTTNVSFNLTSRNGQQHNMFVVGTANGTLDAENVLPKLREVILSAQTLYLGGCFKLKGLQSSFGEIADIVAQHEATLVVDHGRVPSDTPVDTFAAVKGLVLRANYYLPSKDEFCALWGVDSTEAGLHMLHDQAPNLVVVVKDSSNGAFYFADEEVKHAPAVAVESVVSLTGAGDSFNAGFMAAMAKKLPVAEAVSYGCSVAAAKISGRDVPKPEEV
jgi:ribokinase